jgi:DNA helicase HerA-like ATPase
MNHNYDKFKSQTPPNKIQPQKATPMDLSNIRIREHFGLVANDSHGDQFSFLISPPKNRLSVEKTDYILVDHPLIGEACQILAVITQINSYEEIAGSTINDKKAKMLATAQIIGCIDLRKENKKIDKLLVPPNPGSRVYIPLKEFLQDILNRNIWGENYKTPVELGIFEGLSAEQRLDNGHVTAYIDADEFAGRNSLITAVADAGKTYVAQKILAAIADKVTQKIIILDAYGEYNQLQAAELKVTAKTSPESLLKQAEKSRILRVSARGLSMEEKRGVYTEFLKALLKAGLEDKIGPSLIVVEDAENLKGSTLEEAVVVGTKIQLAMCLLSTHPSELGGKILSNTSSQLIGRTVDREDTQFLKSLADEYDVSRLSATEWVINGVSRSRAMKICI